MNDQQVRNMAESRDLVEHSAHNGDDSVCPYNVDAVDVASPQRRGVLEVQMQIWS